MLRQIVTLAGLGAFLFFTDLQTVRAQAEPEGMSLVRAGEKMFYMDVHEVTVEQMVQFDPDYAPAYEYFKDAKMPATAIPFDRALAYCKAQGKRLPTSEEWVLACRGQEGLVYAYGNNYDPVKARVGRRIWTDGPKAVGTYAPNAFGVYDLSGNVWEWADNGEAAGEMRAVHGGSWTDGPRLTQCTSKRLADPGLKAVNYGFRCARSLTDADRARLAAIEAEKLRKAQEAVRREEARRRAEQEARGAAERARVDAEAQKVKEAEAAERRAREAEAARKAAAFAQKVAGMVKIESSAFQTFYLDPHEVTVAEYRAHDASYRPDEFSAKDRMPATGVTYAEAQAYCRSLGKRLPTAEEWTTACLGEKGYLYSYGPVYDPSRGRTGLAWYAGAAEAGAGAANAYGVRDLVGNVWEWADGWYGKGETHRALYGGSWVNGPDRAKCTGGTWALPDERHANVGFRCAVGEE